MVVRWAYVKELATANTGRDENKGFIRLYMGSCDREEEERVSIEEETKGKM